MELFRVNMLQAISDRAHWAKTTPLSKGWAKKREKYSYFTVGDFCPCVNNFERFAMYSRNAHTYSYYNISPLLFLILHFFLSNFHFYQIRGVRTNEFKGHTQSFEFWFYYIIILFFSCCCPFIEALTYRNLYECVDVENNPVSHITYDKIKNKTIMHNIYT